MDQIEIREYDVGSPAFGRSEGHILLQKIPGILGVIVDMVSETAPEDGRRALEGSLEGIDILQHLRRPVTHILEPDGVLALVELGMFSPDDADFQSPVDSSLIAFVDFASVLEFIRQAIAGTVKTETEDSQRNQRKECSCNPIHIQRFLCSTCRFCEQDPASGHKAV